MKLHNVSNTHTPRAAEPSAPSTARAQSASSWSVASAIKYAFTYGVLLTGGAAARAMPQATGADGALALPRDSGAEGYRRLLARPPRFDPAVLGLDHGTEPLTPAPAPAPAPAPRLAIPESRAAVQPSSPATFLIAAKNGGGYVLSASRPNGQPLGLTNDLSPGPNNTFALANGTIATGDGRCVDVKGGAFKSGTAVDAWPCNGHSNQKWDAPGAGTSGPIKPKGHGDLCLDVPGGRYTSDAKLQLFKCKSDSRTNANQQFTVTTG